MKKKQEKRKATTMADVAAAVGVSKTTISRYLHGDYEFMSDETREKIRKVIEQLNYRPNRAAQNLKADKSNCIGLSIADIGNPFSSLLMKGVQSECRKRGCQLLIADADNDLLQEQKNMDSFINEQVDGLIVNSVGDNKEFMERFYQAEDHKPMVLLDRTYRPIFCDSVVTNNEMVTRQMLEELKKNGYEYIVFVSEKTEGISTRAIRRESVEAFFKEDHAVQGEVFIFTEEDKLDRMAKLAEILNNHSKVCFFANNDEVLRNLISYFFHMEQRIGIDLGLCAFADEKWAKYSGPGITCIEQHPFDMGVSAAQILFQRMDHELKEKVIYKEIPADICKYESTKSINEA